MHRSRREANLLGSASLAIVDRMLAACRSEASSTGESAAGIVAAATFLAGGSIEALSRSVGLTHSATVRLVDKLEARGELERHPGPDRRSVAVVATRQGKNLAGGVLAARETALEEMLGALTAAERRELARLHEKLLAGVVRAGATTTNVCRLCDADSCGHDVGRCPVTEAARQTRR